jgi:Tfp pilus assembly protein PilF/mono/diheme cytochrome c family protein
MRKHATISVLALGLAAFIAAAGVKSSPQSRAQQPAQHKPMRASTFAHDVAPILYSSCASCHHDGGSAPFSLTSFADALSHATRIADAVRSHEMPPWLPEPGYGDFVDSRRLTEAQIGAITDWVRGGALEGNVAEEPSPPQFTEGWQLGPPDMVVEAARAYTIPATGPDVFWNFIFTPPVTTTRFVRAIEIHPGDTHLIHHANVIVDPARSARRQEKEPGAGFPGMDLKIVRSAFDIDSHFLFWKPGSTPWSEPDGLSWRLNPGDDLVLNAHMMTSGKPHEVKPSIGLYFTDRPPTKYPILVQLEHDGALNIPPGDPDFVVSDDFKLPLDVDVLGVYPHAHYLGHIVEGYATLPNGTRKQLIRITHWDPKWQAVYHYREPVFLPKGSVLSMRWHYDNSTANPRNPNHPPRRVHNGDQSTDEMAHLTFQLLPRGPGDLRREVEEAVMRHKLDKYPDDYQAHIWLGALMLSRLDPSHAVSILDEAVQIDPKKPEGHDWLGVALVTVGRSGEAIREFHTALAIQPEYTNARYNLAKALAKAGQLDEAAEDFSQVVAAYPENGQIRDEYGQLLMRMGKPAEAVQQFEKALQINPSDESAKTNRDRALHQVPQH